MEAVEFLSIEQLLRLQEMVLAAHGGLAGIRDLGLLEAAAAMPRQSFGGQYMHPTLPEMAAAYLFHLCKNHAFIDGNKRVAISACVVFLKITGWTLDVTHDQRTDLTFQVAEGRMTKAEAATFLDKHIRKLDEA